MFTNLQQNNTRAKCILKCVHDYEDMMEEPLRFSPTHQDLAAWHERIKTQILSSLNEKWTDDMGLISTLSARVSEAIDQAYITIKRSCQQSKLLVEHLQLEEKSKESALNHYCSEMDVFMERLPNVGQEDIDVAHREATLAAVNMFKECDNVRAEAVVDLKQQIYDFFKSYKSRAKLTHDSTTDSAIGIDLGTTYCCVTVYSAGKVEIIPNWAQGSSKTTPSYVAYHEDGTDTFGAVAKDEAFRHPETTIYDAKRMIGRLWRDHDLQNDRKHWPFEMVNENGRPKVKTCELSRYPHEISARLLAQCRLMADDFLGLPLGTVRKAVITVPTYFTEPQRRATAEAGECAGLEVLSILSEPTAAAIAYSWERGVRKEKRTALIYDLGGGTFDVAVAVVEPHSVDIMAVDGDTHLGGQDFDQLLMNHCIQEFLRKEQIDLKEGKESGQKQIRDSVSSTLTRLKYQCEKAKERMSSAGKTNIGVERIHGDKHLMVTVTRKEFEDLITPLVQKTIDIVDRLLEEVKSKGVLDKAAIDDIILVGGSTRVPLVANMLSAHFNGKKLCKHINPDEAVAIGAGVQAALLNNSKTIHPINVQDVTPMTLGVQVNNDDFHKIIPKNSKIPCEQTVVHTTTRDNQTALRFHVYQGEHDKTSGNKWLGKFRIGGLPAKPAGQENTNTTMKIDANGLLHVSAVSQTTGNSSGITISGDSLGMDSDTMTNLKKKFDESIYLIG